MTKSSQHMVDSLELKQIDTDTFVARHQVIPSGRAYGGEIVGQAVAATMASAPSDRVIHSFHGYFLRPGDVYKETRYVVDRVRDGRGFSSRAVTGFQDGKALFQGQASYQVPSEGVSHQVELPGGLTPPDELPTAKSVVGDADVRDAYYWGHDRSFDIRHSPAAIYKTAAGERVNKQVVWLKAYDRLPDDKNLHRAALAYLCDYTLLEPILRNHGAAWSDPGLMTASLDHAMWWHADGRVDDWIVMIQESPVAGGGRGLSHGKIYTQDGVLLASVSQEGLVTIS
jgi:acyl-CoA thioesterase-2